MSAAGPGHAWQVGKGVVLDRGPVILDRGSRNLSRGSRNFKGMGFKLLDPASRIVVGLKKEKTSEPAMWAAVGQGAPRPGGATVTRI